jgi:hypothetical protein
MIVIGVGARAGSSLLVLLEVFVMRFTPLIVAIAALGTASAFADQPTPTRVTYSPEFQNQLDEEYGAREGVYLTREVNEAVAAALAARGVALNPSIAIEVTIVDADPNRPTIQQISDRPGLDAIRSISIGGANLHAVLRRADGTAISEVDHRRYNHSIEDVGASTTWSEARRAIHQFANKVADAYVAAG